ncbi:MAG: aminopeptidase, partial [bacterium]|nr:aminopeptidase [bacterium]
MTYQRNQKLAQNIVHYSTKVKPGDVVFIHARGRETLELAEAVLNETLLAGGVPYMHIEDDRHLRRLLLGGTEATFQALGAILLAEMKQAQCYVAIRGQDNVFELADVPKEKLELYDK